MRLGRLVKRQDQFIQKGVDVLFVIDMLKLTFEDRVQHMVLIAGDADYVPAIREVKDEGIKVHLFHSVERSSLSDELYDICDSRHRLTREYLERFTNK